MKKNDNSFKFSINNTKAFVDRLVSQNINEKKLFVINKKGLLASPIDDFFIDISKKGAELSFLSIIKLGNTIEYKLDLPDYETLVTGSEQYYLLKDSSGQNMLTIRQIENFGIYIFAGRPDLAAYNAYSPGIVWQESDSFYNKLEVFRQTCEILVNKIYSDLGLNNFEHVEYNLIFSEALKQPENQKKDKHIPAALQRVYEKMGKMH